MEGKFQETFEQLLKDAADSYIRDKTAYLDHCFKRGDKHNLEKAWVEQKLVYQDACIKGLIEAVTNIRTGQNEMFEQITDLRLKPKSR